MSKTIVLTWQDIVSFFIYARLSQYTVLSFTFEEIDVFTKSIKKTALEDRINLIITNRDYKDASDFIQKNPNYFLFAIFSGNTKGFYLASGIDKNEVFCEFLGDLNVRTYKLLKTAFNDCYED